MASSPPASCHVVVVGAGLAGLSAAWRLCAQLPDTARLTIVEGRDRVGGRTLTHGAAGESVDLGAAWMWPEHNPSVRALAKELGTETVPEGDGGVRFRGGSQVLSLRLAETLQGDDRVEMCLGTTVEALHDSGGSVEVRCRGARGGEQQLRVLRADLVFVACPPRLVAESIVFSPALDGELMQVMQSTRTWMAQQGKFVAEYPTAFWREGLGGRKLYWSRVPAEGPLEMLFESGRVLYGFLANEARWRSLPKEQRRDLILSQLAQMFGEAARAPSSTAEMDWAAEALTCSRADAKEPEPWRHPRYRRARTFEQGVWQQRLWFVGSETAPDGAAGFLDGAVQSAQERVEACRAAWPSLFPRRAEAKPPSSGGRGAPEASSAVCGCFGK